MTRRRSKATDPVQLGEIVANVLRNCRPQADTELVALWDLWPDIVSQEIAANAGPAAFKGDLLLIHVSSPVWAHHLQFLKTRLIDDINKALGQKRVREVRFKIGPV